MKRLIYFMIVALFACTACEGPAGAEGEPGPQGPQGPQGPAGPAGTAQQASILEFPATFEQTENGNYMFAIPLSGYEDIDLDVGESDVVLVYTLTGFFEDDNGDPIYVWGLLPQTYTPEEGSFTYSYSYANVALFLFADATFDLSTTPDYIEDRTFRLVVIPAENLYQNGRISDQTEAYKNMSYKEVIKTFKIDDRNVPRYQLK